MVKHEKLIEDMYDHNEYVYGHMHCAKANLEYARSEAMKTHALLIWDIKYVY